MRAGDREYTRGEIERQTGNISQLGGTRHVELRRRNRLPHLEPGESRTMEVEVEVLAGSR